MKRVFILISFSVLLAINSFAQPVSEISVTGMLKLTDEKFSINDFVIQPKRDDEGKTSYFDENRLKSSVGKEVSIKGNLLESKVVEVIEIRDFVYKAKESDYPVISQKGKTLADFLPKDWVILDQAKGDLNGDNLEDMVAVIKSNDIKFMERDGFPIKNYQLLINPITNVSFPGHDGNPRILIVLLNEGNGYKLFLQNNAFIEIPRHPVGETFESVKIENGKLALKHKWSDHHWVYGNSTHYFSFQNSELILSNLDVLTMRYAGYGREKNYDFVKKTAKKTEIKERGKKTEGVEKKRLKVETPFNLKKMTSWEVDDVYKDLFSGF